MSTLNTHYEPKPLVIAERFYFHQRNQGASESVVEYVAELRRLATHCEFGTFLSDALRDRLVCGLRSAGIQKRLLSEADITLKKAIELAQGMEAAEANAKKLLGGESASAVHLTGQRTNGKTLLPLWWNGPPSQCLPFSRCNLQQLQATRAHCQSLHGKQV